MVESHRALVALLLLCAPLFAQSTRDLYPAIRSILAEAEESALRATQTNERRRTLGNIGGLYARAGYLDDSARVYARAGQSPEFLAVPMAVYGEKAASFAIVETIVDPISKAAMLTTLATTYWQLGDKVTAAALLTKASASARTIPDPSQRKLRETLIAQLRGAVSDEPPYRISPIPQPPSQSVEEGSPIPPFPITVDGFRDPDPKAATARAAENGPFLTRLYAYIPENTPDCVLAKAEALAAVASAWSRAGDTEHARAAFTAAIGKLDLVADLPYGRAWIAADIAARQAAAGFVATSRDAFALAAKFAQEVPPRPKPVNGVYPRNYAGRHYRDDAYQAVVRAQLRARDLGGAFRTADLWRAAGGDADDVVIEFHDAGFPAEALQYARTVPQAAQRADALARIARHLLDNAGAPVI